MREGLGLRCVNHVSYKCKNLDKSLEFYVNLLGFVPIRRPDKSLSFRGAWLYNYGVGVHLLGDNDWTDTHQPEVLDPKNDHLSFQCDSLEAAESVLQQRRIRYVKQTVEEGGVSVEQLFFLDPDGHMIEICTCDRLPIIPLEAAPSALGDTQPDCLVGGDVEQSLSSSPCARRSSLKGLLAAKRLSSSADPPTGAALAPARISQLLQPEERKQELAPCA